MAIKSFKRYEKKYLLTGEQYEKLIPRLLEYMKMDDHCVNNSYSIYNIYYDTDDNSVIRHSISKPYYKEKLRLRSYKIPQSPSDKVFLELKKKINKIVNKRRAIITLMEVKILDAIPMWLAEIFSELKIYNTHFSKYGNEYMTYSQEQNNHNKNRREKIC